jgi:hypothetical protein
MDRETSSDLDDANESAYGSNVCTDGWEDVPRATIEDPEDDAADVNDGFGVEGFYIDERDKERLLKLSDYDLARLMDYFTKCNKLTKIDVDKSAGKSDPLLEQIDWPTRCHE